MTGGGCGQADLGHAWAASPALAGDRVIVGLDGLGQEDTRAGLVAFSTATGAVLWSRPLGTAGDPPVVSGGALYVFHGHSVLAAYSVADGTPLWSTQLDNGTDGSPAVAGDAVFLSLPCGDTLRLRRADGAPVWRTPRDCAGGGGDVAVLAGERVYGSGPEWPPGSAYDAATGATLARWRTDYTPAFSGRTGVFADARRPRESLPFGHRLVARAIPSGAVRWRFSGDGYLDTPPLIAGGVVYAGSGAGRVYGVSLRTGRRVARANVGAPVHGPLNRSGITSGLAAGGGLLVVPAYGRVVAFE